LSILALQKKTITLVDKLLEEIEQNLMQFSKSAATKFNGLPDPANVCKSTRKMKQLTSVKKFIEAMT